MVLNNLYQGIIGMYTIEHFLVMIKPRDLESEECQLFCKGKSMEDPRELDLASYDTIQNTGLEKKLLFKVLSCF